MKRRLLLILFVLLVAGGGLFVWNASRDARADTFALADGSVLEFHGFTSGTNHSYCFGNPLQRMAARIPGKLGEMLHGKTVVKAPASASESAVFWFLIRTNSASAKFDMIRPLQDGGRKAMLRCKWQDDGGNDFGGSTRITLKQLPSGDLATYFSSYGVDLNSPTVHLKLSIWCGPGDKMIGAEFVAPNPLYRKQP